MNPLQLLEPYRWLLIPAAILLGVYLLGQTILGAMAYWKPQTRALVVEKKVIQTNVVVKERIVTKPGGEQVVDRITTDTSTTNVNNRTENESKPVLPPAPFWSVLGAYRPFQQEWVAGGGVNLGPFTVYASHPVALRLAPEVGAFLRF